MSLLQRVLVGAWRSELDKLDQKIGLQDWSSRFRLLLIQELKMNRYFVFFNGWHGECKTARMDERGSMSFINWIPLKLRRTLQNPLSPHSESN